MTVVQISDYLSPRKTHSKQYQIRRKRDLRKAQCERKRDAGNDEKNRRSSVETSRDNGHYGQHREQQQKRLNCRCHGSHTTLGSGPANRFRQVAIG